MQIMRLLLLSIVLIFVNLNSAFASTIATSEDQISLLQLHRFNQLQMQMAMMVDEKTDNSQVTALASKVHSAHKDINNDVVKFAKQLDFDLNHVPNGIEEMAKSEHRPEFVNMAKNIQVSDKKEVERIYPKWARSSNRTMYRQLEESIEDIESPEIKQFFRNKMKLIETKILLL